MKAELGWGQGSPAMQPAEQLYPVSYLDTKFMICIQRSRPLVFANRTPVNCCRTVHADYRGLQLSIRRRTAGQPQVMRALLSSISYHIISCNSPKPVSTTPSHATVAYMVILLHIRMHIYSMREVQDSNTLCAI